MSDITEKLRNDQGIGVNLTLCREAADEIERLQAQNAALREALEWYVDNDDTNEGGDWDEINSFWLEGRDRAIALLAALATGGEDE